jgi:hypothetical protein
MYRLQFQSGRNKGRRLLVRQASAVVGSSRDCTVRLREKDCPPPQVCRLEKRPDGVAAIALDAEFPLILNGRLLEGEGILKHGDVLSIGGVDVQYQDIIPPGGRRLKPGGGVLGPVTGLAILLLAGAELGLLAVTSNWPKYLIEENVEKIDIAYAAKQRELRGEKEPEEGEEKKPDAASIIVMPGTSPAGLKADAAPAAPDGAEGAGSGDAVPAEGGEAAADAEGAALADLAESLKEALDGADFEKAEIGDILSGVPASATAFEPVQDSLETLLTEAKTAAQFSDYPRAFQLLNQLHQTAPGYLPAHMYHAQLLEARGDLEGAYRRWKQLMGLAGKDDAARTEIVQAGRRLQQQLRLRKNVSGYAGVDPETLPRRLRIEPATMQKMPADTEIAEMRILRGKIVPGDGAGPAGEETLQLFVTFYDQKPGGEPVPTRALVSPSPIHLSASGANPAGALTFEATYIVPAVRGTGAPYSSLYYGYTLHLFADGVLQDAFAKPDKLLVLPIHTAAP